LDSRVFGRDISALNETAGRKKEGWKAERDERRRTMYRAQKRRGRRAKGREGVSGGVLEISRRNRRKKILIKSCLHG
jgi:hypothetical protein